MLFYYRTMYAGQWWHFNAKSPNLYHERSLNFLLTCIYNLKDSLQFTFSTKRAPSSQNITGVYTRANVRWRHLPEYKSEHGVHSSGSVSARVFPARLYSEFVPGCCTCFLKSPESCRAVPGGTLSHLHLRQKSIGRVYRARHTHLAVRNSWGTLYPGSRFLERVGPDSAAS